MASNEICFIYKLHLTKLISNDDTSILKLSISKNIEDIQNMQFLLTMLIIKKTVSMK